MLTRVFWGVSLTVATTLTLAACEKPQQPPAVDNAAIGNVVEEPVPAEDSDSPGMANASNATAPAATPTNMPGFPPAFRGRWGMNEADCDVSRADNKGLVTVNGDSLKFYESLGTLRSMTAISPTEIKATFAFSGEGQNWDKDMTLKLENGGTTLVRVEKDPAATYRHKKCA